MTIKKKILVCGILPPPNFGHSMIHAILMRSPFEQAFNVIFFNMKFWSYKEHKRVTFLKILKMMKYYFQFIWIIISRRPQYVLYGISFDKMPFLKDFLFCMTARFLGCKVVLHDMGQYAGILYNAYTKFGKSLMRFFFKNIAASIVLGEHTKGSYEGLFDRNKVFAVPGAVEDTQNFSMIPQPKDEARVNVLYFSFLSRTKGVLVALKAATRVIQTYPNIHFTFVGPIEAGGLEDEINQFIVDHHISDNVHMFGYEDNDFERSRYFRFSDIFIFPTLRDVFGLVLLHAMVEAVPVIASREGTIPEIVEDGKTGFLIDKGDDTKLAQDIIRLANDKQLRKQMGKAGRTRFLSFYTPKHFGERMINVFEQI